MKRFYTALRRGPRVAAGVAVDRAADYFQERRLGIRSSGLIPIETLIDDWQGNHDYAPTSIRAFRAFIEAAGVAEGSDIFVDYGCGMGRVLALASEYPFRRVVGVEISPRLAAAARENLARFRGERRCRDVAVWCGNAEAFEVPADATVFYFFNPFHGRVLLKVFDRLRQSFDAHPRRLRIIFNNPTHFLRIVGDHPWLVARRRFSFEHDCVIYEGVAVA